MNPLNWTPALYLHPRRFIEVDDFWVGKNFYGWSESVYDYEYDGWNGLLDVTQYPRETWKTGRGDCEDYAVVAATYLLSNGHQRVTLAFVGSHIVPEHVVATDGERVFSSGRIHDNPLDEYLADSDYKWAIRRHV